VCPVFGEHHALREVRDGITIYRYRTTFADGSVGGYLREYSTAFVRTVAAVHRVMSAEGRIHVCHAANPPDIFWPLALYLRLFGTRFIFDEHDLAPELYLSRFQKADGHVDVLYRLLRLFQKLSYRVADVIISTNESYRASALASAPGRAGRVFVVRNGPDTRWFREVAPRDELRRGHKHVAAYIGVMGVSDGVEYILRSMDILVNTRGYRDLIVYLIGTGDDWERLTQLAAELKLGEHVVFTGRIPDAPALEILCTADICLSPDPHNAMNDRSTMTKIMEYMALGKPIVSFDLKESRVSAAESAHYVTNNDAEAFADGILTLLGDRSRCKVMAQVGKERVATTLSWEYQAERLLLAYERALA
jgi:glycosyltransferase involved in cell wall biosynthesis